MSKMPSSIRRVDVQVSFLSATLVLLCSLSIFGLCYLVTYQDMQQSLTQRVLSLYTYMEDSLDKAAFGDINFQEDTAKDSYQQMRQLLNRTWRATGVRYLYTAKQAQDGSFMYVADGMEESALEFRRPGDPIRSAISGELHRALSGEMVLPENILKTDWGKVYMAYVPIREGDTVVGALVIGFDAGHQYDTYRMLRIMTPFILLFCCFMAVMLSVLFFHRISNPLYLDFSNTDQLTQLKNRNAYEVDLQNLVCSKEAAGVGIVAIDLDNLKGVNDTLGHEAGDLYIRRASQAIHRTFGCYGAMYRIGGDEFAVLLRQVSEEQLNALAERLGREFQYYAPDFKMRTSLSVGAALFNPEDKDIRATCRRADDRMYAAKRAAKKAAQASGLKTR